MNPNSINNLSGRIAQVLYKFDASYADELSCQIGDVLQIIYKIDDQWVYVRSLMPKLDDRRLESSSSGQFPLNHLNILDIDEHVFSRKNVYIGLANFRFEADGDLDFQKGELLVCTKQIDANWLSGHYLNDPKRKGIFPATHVAKLSLETTTDSSRSKISPKKEEANYSMPLPAKAINAFRSEDMSDFNSRRDYYLDLDFGDYLLIAARLDANWYRGENHLGKKGVFPVSCVELLSTKSGKMDGEDESNDNSVMPVLNRTQRRYTIDSLSTPDVVDDSTLFPRPIQQQIEFSEPETDNKASVINDDSTNLQFNEMILSPIEDHKNIIIAETNSTANVNVNETEKVTKCVVNFDFIAETNDDLSCKSGEMLKVVGEINSEWLRCSNESGRTGMVPAAFVTILGGDDWSMALSDEHQDLSSRDHQVVEVAPYRPVRPPPPPPSPASQQPLKRLMSQSSSSLALLSPPPLPPPPPPALPPPLLAKQRFNLTNASSSLSNLSSPADSTKYSTYKPRKPPMPPSAKQSIVSFY